MFIGTDWLLLKVGIIFADTNIEQCKWTQKSKLTGDFLFFWFLLIIYQVSVIQKLERGRKSISICVAVGNHNVVHLSNADFVVVSLRKNLRLHSLSMFIVSRKGLFCPYKELYFFNINVFYMFR